MKIFLIIVSLAILINQAKTANRLNNAFNKIKT